MPNASIPEHQHAKMQNMPNCAPKKTCQYASMLQGQTHRTADMSKFKSTTMQSVPNAKHYKLPAYQLSMHVTVAILSKIQTCQITKHQGASKPDSILSILHACQITNYVKSKHTAMKTCQGQTFQLHTNQNANILT